jgi:hypothetical protein
MLDIARAVVLLVALVQAVRHRFVLGIAFGVVLAAAFAVVGAAAYLALARHSVDGEYGFAFVYVGPTMLPYGGRPWLPAVVQFAFAALSAVPAITALRSPSSPVATPFLVVFLPNAMLSVLTALAAFLLWRQMAAFPEYWENPSWK